MNVTFTQCNSYRIKIRFSIEPRQRRHVKGYVFLSFARNIGTHAAKVAKNMSNKYSQKLVDTAKKSATDTIKTASKTAIQKTAEATGDLIGIKLLIRLQVYQKNHTMKKYSQMKLIMKYQKRDIFIQKKRNKLLMN